MALHKNVDDLATLSKLDEDVLLGALKQRYANDCVYTYVGDILVAVNPFKKLNIYNKQWSKKYKYSRRLENAPHVFAVADTAFQAMVGHKGLTQRNQCILISGESGAGKTESTKLIVRQLLELSSGQTQLEQQILQANPLLEAFGNAQTLMNDNSSRFGKYILLRFKDGKVLGAKISEYLLEKSRVTRQAKGEENFHIFYYMFAGLTTEQQQQYHLGDPANYHYLSDGAQCLQTKRAELQQQYSELQNAMDMVGFTDEEQDQLLSLLAAVLTLGNVNIEADENGNAVINSTNSLDTVTDLLGVPTEELEGILTCSVTFTRGEEIRRNYTQAHAQDCRDAVAKVLYGRLFGWIVNKVNSLLVPPGVIVDPNQAQEIGILDIFGFEHFEKNSFEQACINLANEQLQFFFNKHIFMMEQEEYTREAVDTTQVSFVDNKPLLDLFISMPVGILNLLDEEGQIPNGTDETFVSKLNKHFDKNEYYSGSKMRGTTQFTISHYAGKVTYTANGWIEKNRDTIPPGVMEMFQSSSSLLLSKIFKATVTRTGTLAIHSHRKSAMMSSRTKIRTEVQNAKKRKQTVGTQFKNSLEVLMERMTRSQPVFIRCIKPNNDRSPGKFDDRCVKAQLLYTGMLETTKIRREGYAVRPLFAEFSKNYGIITKSSTVKADADSCRRILEKSGLTNWQIGKTKVFLKYWHIDQLDDLLKKMWQEAIKIQRIARGFLARLLVAQIKEEQRLLMEDVKSLADDVAMLNIHAMQIQKATANKDEPAPTETYEILADALSGTVQQPTVDETPTPAPRPVPRPRKSKQPAPEEQEMYVSPDEMIRMSQKAEPPRPSSEDIDEIFGVIGDYKPSEVVEEIYEVQTTTSGSTQADEPNEVYMDFDDVKAQQAAAAAEDSDGSEEDFMTLPPNARPPTHAPKLEEFGTPGTRQASVQWFRQRESKKVTQTNGMFPVWFHGVITRKEADTILFGQPIGSFLVRVSESRLGYSLSFVTKERVRHYMVDQLVNGKYTIIGESKVHNSLISLLDYYQKIPFSNWNACLTKPCGQSSSSECDYNDLLDPENMYLDLREQEGYPIPAPRVKPPSQSGVRRSTNSDPLNPSAPAPPRPPKTMQYGAVDKNRNKARLSTTRNALRN